MPSILLTNVNRVLNKLDELSILCNTVAPAVIALTETWLTTDITDDHLIMCHNECNYSIFRRDRTERAGGGVLVYVRDDIKSCIISDIEPSVHETLWVLLRPKILPRPFSNIVVCLVYCPPWYNIELKRSLTDHITASVDKISRKFPNAAFILCGDFNSLNTDFIINRFNFLQIASAGTRGSNVLDKLFTNCCKFYHNSTDVLPPLGKSDHNCVYLKSLLTNDLPTVGWKYIFSRQINEFSIDNFGKRLSCVDWRPLFFSSDVQFQCNYFYTIISSIFEDVMPLSERRVKNNEKPWVTQYFRHIISQRNKAYSKGDVNLYKKLRNKVNHIRTNLKKDYYYKLMSSFECNNPAKWWKTIKQISGQSSKTNCNLSNNAFKHLLHNNELISPRELPDVLNTVLSSFTSDVPAFDSVLLDSLRASLGSLPDDFVVNEYSVFHALSNLKVRKAMGPEGVPNIVYKSLADLLAAPLCCIINTSFSTAVVPSQWKLSRISPLPKVLPPSDIINHLRPISVTSPLSKIAERFMCDFFNNHFSKYLDPNQLVAQKVDLQP